MLIDNHYYHWYYLNLYAVVVPAFLQLTIFWFWNNFVLPIRLKTIELLHHDNINEMKTDLIPLSFTEDGKEDNWNFGNLNGICIALLFFSSVYLFLYDFSVLMASIW